MPGAIFEWEGMEYEHNPKNADWYWAVGIIATACAIAAILFSNYLLALLIVIAGVTLGLHAAKHPPTHRFTITDRGLVIGSTLHLFEHMRSFAMLEYIEGNRPPMLSIKTDSVFSPHLMIPLIEVDADALYAYLLEHVEETAHEHTMVDAVAAWLGF